MIKMNLLHLAIFLLSLAVSCHGQCSFTEAMLRIENGFISDTSNFRVVATNVATGSLGYTCATGFTFNPAIGNRLTCLSNGAWSPMPVCQSTGRCPMSQLMNFLQTPATMMSTSPGGNFSLPTDGVNTTNVLSGAFVPMMCNPGFVNVGGPLNITCVNGQWTTLPNCVSSSGGGSGANTMPTMTLPPAASGSRCAVNNATFSIANGFISNANNMLIFPDTSTASGWLLFACTPGFALDSTIGGNFSCNNGAWTPQPRCISTGRCPMSTLTQLMSSGSIVPTGAMQLQQTQDNQTHVLGGSFAVLACAPGFTNIGGNLNVTCNANNAWSPLPNCVSSTGGGGGGGSVMTTLPPVQTGGRCAVSANTFSITNGFISNANNVLIFPDTSTASGWVLFACATGFALDPTIGGNFSCNNGMWTPQPRCISTGRCPLSALTQLTSSGSVVPTGAMQLLQTQDNQTHVLGGSFIVLACASGLTNIGGNLNLTCNADNSWSTPPNCVSATGGGGGSVMTTMSPSVPSGRCAVNSGTLNIANGFVSNANNLLIFPDTSSASGWVVFACGTGFALDPTIGGNFSCNNGVWSPQPRCTSTGRCAMSTLTQLMASGTIVPTSSSQLLQTSDNQTHVIGGSFMVFTCAPGLTNIGGSLNVTCNANNAWSTPPNCVSGTGAQVTTFPTTGAMCGYSSSLLTIPNGMATNWNGLILATATQAMSGSFIDYMCTPPFVMVGSSRIVCSNGAWSAQPVCNAPGQAVVTTTAASTLSCSGIPSIANGFVANGSLTHFGNNNYQGQIQFRCNPGFTFTNNVASRWISCINGQWEALPTCIASPLCSFGQLQQSIGNLAIVSHALNALNGNIIPGGWVLFRCRPGLTLNPFSGALNVTCQANGQWSTFPVCA